MGYCGGFCASVVAGIIIAVCALSSTVILTFYALEGLNVETINLLYYLDRVAAGYILITLAFV